MNNIIRILVVMVALGCGSFLPAQSPTPVVVELFTSEGCSSCPPADALLAKLGQKNPSNGVDLILLGEHVDYWNQLGWTDRFSSAQFSQRQGDYGKIFHLASVYTPQMVIDGRLQLSGNDDAGVNRDIVAAARHPKTVQVALRWEGNDRLHVTVQSPGASRANVLLAVTEDGLSTQVGKGENGGKTLHHDAVVRELHELGSLDKNKFETSANVLPHQDWNPAQLKILVLVQDKDGGAIVGASQIEWQH
jgi:hypothetical protein